MNDAKLRSGELDETEPNAQKSITIDGASGEGGGQILRSSLALSLLTGTPFRIERIRGNRAKPGLLRQHLTAVRAATEIGSATVTGDSLGSRELTFSPGTVSSGEYNFRIGTAGSATLVLQAVLPPLLLAQGSSRVVIEGGTHNAFAPPFDFLEKTFLPVLRQMGAKVEAELERPGFYPAGGGRIVVSIAATEALRPIHLVDRGEMLSKRIRSLVSNLPRLVADREVGLLKKQFAVPGTSVSVEEVESAGPGNVAFVEFAFEHVTEVFTGFGKQGKPSEAVAREALRDARRYLKSEAPVGEYLADQLLIPFAMVGSGQYVATTISRHTQTNIEVIERFLDVKIEVDREGQHSYRFTFQRDED